MVSVHTAEIPLPPKFVFICFYFVFIWSLGLHLACYMKEHFGDDELGHKRAWYFFPWHFDFLSRYMPLPESEFGARSLEQPLLQTRSAISTLQTQDVLFHLTVLSCIKVY